MLQVTNYFSNFFVAGSFLNCKSRSFRTSLTIDWASLLERMASSDRACIDSCMRVGWPSRIALTEELLLINFSSILSTATLDGAQANTLFPALIDCRMISTTVVVLPVPGGPWTIETSLCFNENSTACFWESSKLVLNQVILFSFWSSEGGSESPAEENSRLPKTMSIRQFAGPL